MVFLYHSVPGLLRFHMGVGQRLPAWSLPRVDDCKIKVPHSSPINTRILSTFEQEPNKKHTVSLKRLELRNCMLHGDGPPAFAPSLIPSFGIFSLASTACSCSPRLSDPCSLQPSGSKVRFGDLQATGFFLRGFLTCGQ